MASGKLGNAPRADTTDFQRALDAVCRDLAWMIVRDGEGATRVMELEVRGAKTERDARLAAHAVATSPLVKTALHGGDPNWGRMLAALGRSGARFNVKRVSLFAGRVQLVKDGAPASYREKDAAKVFARERVPIILDLGGGSAQHDHPRLRLRARLHLAQHRLPFVRPGPDGGRESPGEPRIALRPAFDEPRPARVSRRGVRAAATPSEAIHFRAMRKLIATLLLFATTSAFAVLRDPVVARHGMVASTSEIASRVGVDVMKKGGNAVDAAVAVALAMAVTWPAAGKPRRRRVHADPHGRRDERGHRLSRDRSARGVARHVPRREAATSSKARRPRATKRSACRARWPV